MKYHCEVCNETMKLKKFFIEHLKDHYEELAQDLDYVTYELEDMGVKELKY